MRQLVKVQEEQNVQISETCGPIIRTTLQFDPFLLKIANQFFFPKDHFEKRIWISVKNPFLKILQNPPKKIKNFGQEIKPVIVI